MTQKKAKKEKAVEKELKMGAILLPGKARLELSEEEITQILSRFDPSMLVVEADKEGLESTRNKMACPVCVKAKTCVDCALPGTEENRCYALMDAMAGAPKPDGLLMAALGVRIVRGANEKRAKAWMTKVTKYLDKHTELSA